MSRKLKEYFKEEDIKTTECSSGSDWGQKKKPDRYGTMEETGDLGTMEETGDLVESNFRTVGAYKVGVNQKRIGVWVGNLATE